MRGAPPTQAKVARWRSGTGDPMNARLSLVLTSLLGTAVLARVTGAFRRTAGVAEQPFSGVPSSNEETPLTLPCYLDGPVPCLPSDCSQSPQSLRHSAGRTAAGCGQEHRATPRARRPSSTGARRRRMGDARPSPNSRSGDPVRGGRRSSDEAKVAVRRGQL